MSAENIDYSAVLADMESKRTALDAAISSLRTFLSGQGISVPSPSAEAGGIPTNGEVPAGAFLGKSIPEAAKLYLQIVKRKSTTKEIAEALRRGGMESTSENFMGIVHAVLDRYRKSGGEIVKLDRSMWGLAAWYPAGVRTTVQEKPKRKTKVKTKAKAKAKTSPAPKPEAKVDPIASAPQPQGKQQTLDAKIEALLLQDKTRTFWPKELTKTFGAEPGPVNFALGRLARHHKAEKTGDGGFRAFSGKVQEMPLAG